MAICITSIWHVILGDDLGERLSFLKEKTAEESKEITKLEDECDRIKTSLQAANVKQAEIREESAFLKAENSRLKESISSSYLLKDNLDVMKINYQDQVVSSPDKFRKQISNVEYNLDDMKGGNKNLDKKTRELKAWTDCVDVAQLWIKKVIRSMNEYMREVDNQRQNHENLDKKRQEVEERRNELSQTNSYVDHELRRVHRVDDKISELRKQGSRRSKTYSENISSLHKDLIDCESAYIKSNIKAEHVKTDSIMAEKELEAARAQQDQQKQLMHASYKRLEKIIIDHLHTLRDRMDTDNRKNVQQLG